MGFHQTVEKGHRRIETRRCGAVADPENLKYVNDGQSWPHWQSLVRVESTRRRRALNLLRQETSVKSGIAAKRKRAGWDMDYLYKVLVP